MKELIDLLLTLERLNFNKIVGYNFAHLQSFVKTWSEDEGT